jgi:hypothetical protein
MADDEITKRKEDDSQQKSPLQNKINSLENAVTQFEAFFNSFSIVGGDGVEVSGNLRTGYIINAR